MDIVDGGSPGAPYKQSHWLSESGEIDVFLLPGPTPAAVYAQVRALPIYLHPSYTLPISLT